MNSVSMIQNASDAASTTVLVTGGCGYIGSHTVLQLLEQNYNVVVVDNLSNSRDDTVSRLEEHSGKRIYYHNVDITHSDAIECVFQTYASGHVDIPPISVVIHFAAFKAVNESNNTPLKYYHNNVYGTIVLVEVMKKFNVKRLIFSSSAVVYGIPSSENRAFIGESVASLSLTNPYGRTKKMCEDILQDVCSAEKGWKVILLRYFNPVGAHPDAIVGEDPVGIPNNLMPYVARVAAANLLDLSSTTSSLSPRLEELRHMTHLNVFGSDYDTKDGSGVRDFIHVMDLANGHLLSLKAIMTSITGNGPWWSANEKHAPESSICRVYNLGSGQGHSVLDIVSTFSESNGVEVPFKLVDRRPGDVPCLVANPTRAKDELGFKCSRNLQEMCTDVWRWQKKITLNSDLNEMDPNENPVTVNLGWR